MVSLDLKNRMTWLVIACVTFFSLFALWLRLLPMFNMGNIDILSMVASDDPLYNLRQVEFLLSNHLNYQWFDPMTLYPAGSEIYWGPLFPIIIAMGCLITGAATRPEIISVGLLIPPLMGAAIVAVMYYVGKLCGNWKTGLLASGFTAIVTGQFFSRAMYGYMDHHIAEVLFATIFCLFYMYAVLSEKDTRIDLKKFSTYKTAVLISVLAGIAYLLGLFVMPTMILFAMIAGIFTVIQFIIDTYRGKTSEYLLIINLVIFIIAIIGLLAFGLKNTGMNLSSYSVGHIFAYLGMIGGTVFLYLLQQYLKARERFFYPATIIVSVVVFAVVLHFASPQLYSLFISALFAFFGQAAVSNTVQEARGWAMDLAWTTFNYGLLLMAGGFLVMIYNNIREERPEQVFAIVWSVIILFSTWQHIRYEYYLAINVALLAAVCVGFIFERGWQDIRQMTTGIASPTGSDTVKADDVSIKRKKQKKTSKSSPTGHGIYFVSVALSVVIVALALLFTYTSISYSYINASGSPSTLNPDWKESAEWMVNNTPDTGVNYYTLYDKNTFSYPNGSYGVMSWWDYGHIITTIGKRIPNANPFQQGVAGGTGSAAYFMATSEDTANTILDTVGTRYIITDVEMDQGKFWAMATWFNSTESTGPYYDTLFLPGQDNSLSATVLNKQPYYLTMISRLHNFDGSMAEADSVYYIVYADPGITGLSLPVITDAELMNASAAVQKAAQYNRNPAAGHHAAVYSPSVIAPLETVPALQHYRLVHESPTNVFSTDMYDLKYVKTFEYVKGAHITGEGIIEVPVVSNTGRNYTYRQASVNGEFIVPYSTSGNPYEVKTTGKYRVIGTGREYDVSESAVMQGLTVQ
ncbi:MAG: oligosaccharyl transferase, archaeosortase A system-associated [Methanoregula sp.]|uniref:oligosaccharyl transferase, archaeosortase A system-associated n=1 Tax=Methanoregula sp. TaxID=2052170 RepID=UPI0025D11C23|nr:oligosaccharyl transferase, archaeosortase A system-associated [Methanoregula sp.]MCK9631150.1 oligosaccharyl transferase, archaeosortase A system-associated [Methanoregula sp.]